MTARSAVAPRVRRARASDLDGLVALWTGITHHHRPLDSLYTLRPGAEPAIRSLLRSMLDEERCAVFVAELGEELVGMSGARVDRAPPILVETERAEITDLGVHPDHRRRGIGRALAEMALAWVRGRGIERVEVRVVAENRGGQAFWRELGFGDHVQILQRRAGGPVVEGGSVS